MARQYSIEDEASMSQSWMPKAGTPFVYEICKSDYNYNEKRWNYGVYKSFEKSISIMMNYGTDTLETAEELLEMAKQSGNVEKFFADRQEEHCKKARAEWFAEIARKVAENDIKRAERMAEFERLGNEERGII